MENAPLRYKRSRFATRLPVDCLYTPGHYWLRESAPGEWQVGFTKFALRMLGDIVEFDIEVEPGAAVGRGDVIGWLEGFKAVTDLYSPLDGVFRAVNEQLADDLDMLKSDSYGRGWFFCMEGQAGDDCVDAEGYASFLDETIDHMLGQES